jgi:UDP-N-acetylglucosamine diphosphorylase / glucose-1-phosphate thymidylyltransferase / UDP-N-acetylgalactosamine diphosphorylase / glucosamine-1-phosphate N-acetyltransferase / galactosamine-1-phosphate N-acetyltransferase
MVAHICIYEDALVDRLFPLVYFRPAYDLRCGITTLREKIVQAYPKSVVTLHTRQYLADFVRLRNPKLHVNEIPPNECLFINGRVVADQSLTRKVPLSTKNDVAYVHGGTIVAAHLGRARLEKLGNSLADEIPELLFADLPRVEVDVKIASYPWDLVHMNGQELVLDFKALTGKKKKRKRKKSEGPYLLGKQGIFIADSAVIKPGVVLDAEKGPIYIGNNVTILPFTTIVGPAYIGDGSIVKANSTIYENTSIGPVCKVGGEIEGSIIHGYSNKQHSGFLGHSYVGAWVNLGAGTNNSDLKNNYGTVKVHNASEEIETGLQFVGLTMGDHSKSAINSMFNTGTIVGVSSNIADSGFPPKYVPSFSWLAPGGALATYKVDRAIAVARKVMARRNVELTSVEEAMFRKVFEMTTEERRKRGMSA